MYRVLQAGLICLTLLLTRSLRGEGPAGSVTNRAKPDDAQTVLPGHSQHGTAFDEGPRQKGRLMPGMPEIRFALTTTNELTRQFFLQGIGQLHGFWYLEAERSFREAASHDTNCAAPYWGMAYAALRNTTRAGAFIQEAVKRRAQASPYEQLWIDALAAFLKDPKGDEKERRREYTRALENLVFLYPDDVEAKAFLAVHVWESGSQLPIHSAQMVESLLKEIFVLQPMHPAHHYRIHLWDGEKDESAVRALPSAARSGQTSPGIAHQWHMAGHTFNKLKRYPDMAWQQEASVRVDNTQLMADRLLPDQIHNYAHNSEWLIQTYNYLGQVSTALQLAQNMVEFPRHPRFNAFARQTNGVPYPELRGTSYHGRRRLLETLLRWELWDDVVRLAETPLFEPTQFPEEQARRARLLGLAHLARGETNAYVQQLAALDAAAPALRRQRQDAVEAAEAAAKAEKKGRGDIEKAMSHALSAYSEPLENLDHYRNELRAFADLQSGETNEWATRVAALTTVSKERLAGWWFQSGNTNRALELATEAVQAATNQVHPLAVHTELLWRAGRTNDALQAFARLRPLTARLDLDLPIARRLAPVVAAAGLSGDWRPSGDYPSDSGIRPPLDSLGSLRWDPRPAPDLQVTSTEGQPVRLADYRGRPVLVVFYLGHRCVHCLEQLNLLKPRTAEFRAAGVEILAVSTDTVAGLSRTLSDGAAEDRFPFPLTADPERTAFRAWHAFDDFEETALHGLFLVDGSGRVVWQDVGAEPFTDFHFLLPEARRLLSLPRT